MIVGAAIARHAATMPDRIALRFEQQTRTWRELDDDLSHIGAWLRARAPAGAGVALHLPNGPPLAVLALAAARAGLEAQLLDTRWPRATTLATLTRLAPACVITADAALDAPHVVRLPDATMGFAALRAHFDGSGERLQPPSPDAPFYVGFTSGSTGAPKGYRRTHRSWVESFAADAQEFGLTTDDVVLAPGDLTHSLFFYALANGLHHGASVVIARRFRPDLVAHELTRGATALYAVPTQLRLLADWMQRANAGPVATLRWLIVSGARWTPQARETLRATFPCARFAEFYGASELSFVAIAKDGDATPPNSVGRAFHGVALSIRDAQGRVLPQGEAGLVCARSAMTFAGYATGDDDVLRFADADGVALSVGDIGRLDADGFLFLEGRADRMIVVSAKNLYPEEIERALETHAAIAGAAVLPAPDEKRGARLVALIALRDDALVSRAQLVAHARQTLPAYKIPHEWRCVRDWPLTRSGKTDFAALRAMLETGACGASDCEVLS